MEKQPKRKYASELERRRKPLKDVDAVERARLLKAAAWLVPASLVFFMFVTSAAIEIGGLGTGEALLVGIVLGLGGPFIVYGIIYVVWIGGLASFIGRIYFSSSSEPLPPTSWRAQALIARGSHREALKELEEEAAHYPEDPGPCMRAASLCAQELDDLENAIAWYLRARRAGDLAPETDQFISLRVADLYEAVGEEGRARVELRRLLERHPGSQHAPHARSRLAALKARQLEAEKADEAE